MHVQGNLSLVLTAAAAALQVPAPQWTGSMEGSLIGNYPGGVFGRGGGWSQRGPLPAKISVGTFLKPKGHIFERKPSSGTVRMVTYGVEGHISKSKSSITLNLLCCWRVWRVTEFKYKRRRYYPELAEHHWFRCWVDCSNIWIAVLPWAIRFDLRWGCCGVRTQTQRCNGEQEATPRVTNYPEACLPWHVMTWWLHWGRHYPEHVFTLRCDYPDVWPPQT